MNGIYNAPIIHFEPKLFFKDGCGCCGSLGRLRQSQGFEHQGGQRRVSTALPMDHFSLLLELLPRGDCGFHRATHPV